MASKTSRCNRPVSCVRIQESIKVLIAVTSRLDAVVACINVLYLMENY